MVSFVVILILATIETAGSAEPAASANDDVVQRALARGGYPWYDVPTDSLIAVRSSVAADSNPNELPDVRLSNPGRYVSIGLAAVGIVLFVALLVELWRRHRPAGGALDSPSSSTAGRIAGLPSGADPEVADPWSEALRCRERGDHARAIVCLFAHQLIALERIHVLRLAPGRTGRQLVRAIDDPRLRAPVERTLRVFETVYYGQLAPSAGQLEAVWAEAQELERLIAAGVRR